TNETANIMYENKNGRFDKFLGCVKYPYCKGTRRL
ncbi:uncharacterized protein METZ01_LOCUS310104, partial [marine metagenome]